MLFLVMESTMLSDSFSASFRVLTLRSLKVVGVGSRGALDPRELLPEPLGRGLLPPPPLPLLLLRLLLPPPPAAAAPPPPLETRPDERAPLLGAFFFGGDDLAAFAAEPVAEVFEARPVDLDSLAPAAAEAAGWPGSTGAGGIDLMASPEAANEGVTFMGNRDQKEMKVRLFQSK